MYPIQEKIHAYIKEKSIRDLQESLSIGACTIYRILGGNKKYKYTKKVLNRIYEFFDLSIDDFYKNNVIKTSTNGDIIGNIFRERRERLGISPHDAAKKIKGTIRQITRIETGKVNNKKYLYRKNSYYIQSLMDLYKFTPGEREILENYMDALGGLIQLKKSYHRTRNPLLGEKGYHITSSSHEGNAKQSPPSENIKGEQANRGQQEFLPFWK